MVAVPVMPDETGSSFFFTLFMLELIIKIRDIPVEICILFFWRVIRMTLVQEATKKMETLSDDSIRIIIALMDHMLPENSSVSESASEKMKFLQTAGKIEIDEEAVSELRARSMI